MNLGVDKLDSLKSDLKMREFEDSRKRVQVINEIRSATLNNRLLIRRLIEAQKRNVDKMGEQIGENKRQQKDFREVVTLIQNGVGKDID